MPSTNFEIPTVFPGQPPTTFTDFTIYILKYSITIRFYFQLFILYYYTFYDILLYNLTIIYNIY